MVASQEDRSALRQAFARINTALRHAEMADDADTIRTRLFTLSMAVIDAEALAKAIRDNTRIAAQRELEHSLEQQVGMEMEHL